jgi:hypothetical protein
LKSNWAIYSSGSGAEEVTVEVPQLSGAGDYGRSVGTLLDDLSRLEGRLPSTLLRDVRGSTVDVVRLALEGSNMRDGRIPVEAGRHASRAPETWCSPRPVPCSTGARFTPNESPTRR